ncbi:MAG: glutamate-5-semialdehyde dehydrogenase [Lentisphaeria bacterium]|nr:glutamate-5-semialdehyde dehydrogenase [Lentisphaeria bacterium]
MINCHDGDEFTKWHTSTGNEMNTIDKVKLAKAASIQLAACGTELKNRALLAIASALRVEAAAILAANKLDLTAAEAAGLMGPLLKRLAFNEKKLEDVVEGVESLVKLDDPVGKKLSCTELDEGLVLTKVSCPIGVIGVIFESRPDALVQISTLCLKSGNAAVLKGGSEALNTNRELARVIANATEAAGIPANWLQLLETRADVNEMLSLDDYIDLIIPRGSNAFVKYIMSHTNIAVMGHAEGLCHVYVDGAADIATARKVVVDSKTQYVSVCNAAETLLVDEAIATKILPLLAVDLREKNVNLLGCEKARAIVNMEPATDADWDTEYLDYILSIKVVSGLDEAISHINQHGSGHTDVIVTQDEAAAEKFMSLVDSADVFWNCSSRFADGFRYGLGAEVGISTNKIHARGPVGLEGLVIYKWLLKGNGHIVADYAEGRKHFTHRKL